MKRLHLKTLFPAIIFSLCILELSFGLLISFRVVWWFYLFFFFFLFNVKSILTNSYKTILLDRSIIILYLLSAVIYITHHFLSSHILFDVSTSDAFNILWWSIFGLCLVLLITGGVVDYLLFWKYTYIIVFFGATIAAGLGIVKYLNLLGGRILPSYFYNDKLIPGSSLSTDYNLYSIGLLIAALFSFQVRYMFKGRSFSVFYLMCLSVIYLSSFLSGSRRGLLLTIVVIFLGFFYKSILNGKWKRNFTKIGILLCSVFLLLGAFWGDFVDYMESSGVIDSSIARIFSIKEEFSGENNRTIRFEWAFEKFSNSSFNELIFGNGFSYLSEMGSAFEGMEDHPHNFILSTLLYGGFLAFFIMIVLLLKMLSNTFNHDKTLFFALIILIFFSLSSANTLFSFKIFPTLVFLSGLQLFNQRSVVSFR